MTLQPAAGLPIGPGAPIGPGSIALKIDVCTAEGLRSGVPRLLDLLGEARVWASFFIAFGPDRSGRAVFRLLERGVLRKLLRTRALSLYGLRTALSGTLLPARLIGSGDPGLVRRIRDQGHEVGLHGWDHRLWQDRIHRLEAARVRGEVEKAFAAFEEALGEPARSFAAPAWTASRAALEAIDGRGLDYSSNTRGGQPFYPVIDGLELRTLEVPTTAPCPEEVLAAHPGRDPYGDGGRSCEPGRLEVFPVHAEVEGSPRFARGFREWIERRKRSGLEFVRLEDAARAARASGNPPRRPVSLVRIEGRPGCVLTGWPASLKPEAKEGSDRSATGPLP